tara:strand:- start:1785 stop:2225 length:441 start_codon:yes stop_codon:yes gene_type:complete
MNAPLNYKYAFGNIWLSEKDFYVFAFHTITAEEINAFFGDDEADVFKKNILEIANKEYNVHQMRFDILKYNELIKDEIFDMTAKKRHILTNLAEYVSDDEFSLETQFEALNSAKGTYMVDWIKNFSIIEEFQNSFTAAELLERIGS